MAPKVLRLCAPRGGLGALMLVARGGGLAHGLVGAML